MSELAKGSKLREIRSEPLNEKSLEKAESGAREKCIIQSALLWLHDVEQKLVGYLGDDTNREEALKHLQLLQPHRKSLLNLMTDRVTSELATCTLSRRDAVVKAIPTPVPHEVLDSLRASPFAEPSLFEMGTKVEEFLARRREDDQLAKVVKHSTVQAHAQVLAAPQVKPKPVVQKQPPQVQQPQQQPSQAGAYKRKGPKPQKRHPARPETQRSSSSDSGKSTGSFRRKGGKARNK